MMDVDCITLSDDEVEVLGVYVNVEPRCVDLTEDDEISDTQENTEPPPSSSSQTHHHQSPTQPTSQSSTPIITTPIPNQSFHEHQQKYKHQHIHQNNPHKHYQQHQHQHQHQQHQEHQYPPRQEPQQHQQNLNHERTNVTQPETCQSNSSSHSQQQQHQQKQQVEPTPTPTTEDKPASVSTKPSLVAEPSKTVPQPSKTVPQPTIPPDPEPKPQIPDKELLLSQKALGNEKYKKNQFDDAVRIYRRCVDIAEKLGDSEMSAILHFNLAMSYCNLRSYDQAADECAQAVKLNDNYIKAHLKRAEIYQRQFKFEEAVICYEHICELDRTNSDYIILLNKAREAAKHTQKKDYFAILGLNHNCSKQDIKKAYRQLALKHHPDRHSNADLVTRRIEEKRFKDASEAHTFILKRFSNY